MDNLRSWTKAHYDRLSMNQKLNAKDMPWYQDHLGNHSRKEKIKIDKFKSQAK